MTAEPRGTRITIIDDHALFAESLAISLRSEGYTVRRVDLTANHSSLASVLAATLRTEPRVVLLDLDLGHIGDGLRIIDPLAATGVSVVVVTGSADRVRWGNCLRRGAKTVLPKSCPLDEVMSCVRRAADGLVLMAPDERSALMELAATELVQLQEIRERLERLTRREMEILGDLMHGHQVREIARRSVVSEATVRTQVKAILAKMDTNSQLSAVGAAYKVGWRPPED